MNVLITGGAGFIGSHLADALVKKGDNVVAVDNFSTGNVANIKDLLENERFTLVAGSIIDKNLMKGLVRKADVIYHLAAVVGVQYVIEAPLHVIQSNVHGTEVIMELASIFRKKVFLASTSEVYGKDGGLPYKESGNRLMGSTTVARWSYACTKALDEFMALAYHHERGLPVVIARLFNTVGPRQTGRYGMVIPRFVKSALAGRKLTVYGDGTQSRCFTYVGDAVFAIMALMDTDEAVGEIFNVGSTNEISILDLAEKIIDMTGSESGIDFIPYEEVYGKGFEDMRRRVPCIDKICKLIGCYRTVSLDEILQKVIAYERS